ncbi:MAG: LysM peptidoglycan-binding domain-containing protein [Deltaproteobacteria bacterium]|nr:LysM peptidoglycan-binding domain-containing protein [Deltaproteobacteria bacterium]
MAKTIRKIYPLIAICALFVLPSYAHPAVEIMNVRYWAAPDHTRIVFDTSEEPQYSIEKKDQSIEIVFKDTLVASNVPEEINVKKPDPCIVKIGVLPDSHIRVEIVIPANVSTNIFKLKKFQDKPDRLVIDIELPDIKKQEMQEREQVKTSVKDKIIVIDPGHGGEDPGAVGKRGTLEKDVVLSIGKKIRDILNKKKGYRAFMTRNGDYYVSFKKRTTIAREYGADLFISIHADAALSRHAKGSSVYCLSVGGASSEAAKILARNENLADLVGGSPNGENSDETDPIILNMFQTNTINVSKTFGYGVLKHLNDVFHLKFNTVQEAPFIVLKLPDIPSVLVETAYISNPVEEKLLKNKKFQMAMAQAISKSIVEFLSRPHTATPVVELVKEKKENNIVPVSDDDEKQELPGKAAVEKRVHIVKKGDSLINIALAHQIKVSRLLKLNKMKLNDNLYVGRKLKLTEVEEEPDVDTQPSETSSEVKKERSKDTDFAEYRVREGDSLGKIAHKHHTTISALLKLNGMKLKDPLYAGRLIKINKTQIQETKSGKPSSQTQETTGKAAVEKRVHVVKKGDSLIGIALAHQIEVSRLLKLNKMKLNDNLYVGRKLKLTEAEEEPDGETPPSETSSKVNKERSEGTDVAEYRVREGDSLGKIAYKHHTTISALLKLNGMKLKDPLYAGRLLKIRQMDAQEKTEEAEKPTSEVKGKHLSEKKRKKTHISYKVKKGDTIDIIARRHKISANAILSLNNIKRTDPLLIDQKIKLPQNTSP